MAQPRVGGVCATEDQGKVMALIGLERHAGLSEYG